MLFFPQKKFIIIVVFSPKLLYVLCSLKFSLFHSLYLVRKCLYTYPGKVFSITGVTG